MGRLCSCEPPTPCNVVKYMSFVAVFDAWKTKLLSSGHSIKKERSLNHGSIKKVGIFRLSSYKLN